MPVAKQGQGASGHAMNSAACGTYLLNNVQEDLILLIPQIVLSPANCSCHLHMQTYGLQMYRRHIHIDNIIGATLHSMCICYLFSYSATTTRIDHGMCTDSKVMARLVMTLGMTLWTTCQAGMTCQAEQKV